MIISGAIIISGLILYLGIRDLKSSRKLQTKQRVQTKVKGFNKRKKSCFFTLKLTEASKRTFWFYAKQKQLLILYPKNIVWEKYEDHIKKMIRNYLLSASMFAVLAYLSNFHIIMILNLLFFPILLAYKEDVKLKKESDKYRENILSLCPELFYQLSILMSSGLNIDVAISYIRNNTMEKGGIKYVLDKVYFELERGENLVNSVNIVAQNLNIRALNKFSVILKQIVENGMKNAAGILIDLSEDTMRELQSEIKQKAEKISSKMMMPLMLSLFCIMIMLAVPVMLQM